jgi:ppGpp synthetase/RelA/SpoT-type nucleotidyltranferase
VEKHFSNAQIDRLGDRLRRRNFDEKDLRLLDEYRRTFGPAYDLVVERVQQVTGLAVSGRPAKSTTSIIEKLNRESIRLSQIQDIAGCRTMVPKLRQQDPVVETISAVFSTVTVIDRRLKPSHGYRAVHVVVREGGKAIEVQVRTEGQHVWAEMCEKYADIIDPALKYGGGPPIARRTLDIMSLFIARVDELQDASGDDARALEDEIQRLAAELNQLGSQHDLLT